MKQPVSSYARTELRKLFGEWWKNGKLSYLYKPEDLEIVLAIVTKATEAWRLVCKGKEGAYLKMEEELAYVKLQRDRLLEITWLDLPSEPDESTAKWQEQFNKGWMRRAESSAALVDERQRADKNVEEKKAVMHAYAVSQENDRLKQQLLSAQTAIEAIRNNWSTHDLSNEKLAAILGSQKSDLLHQHDAEVRNQATEAVRADLPRQLAYHVAEVRKPLVGALVKARETIHALHGDVAWEIYEKHSPEMRMIDAALAQCKEKP